MTAETKSYEFTRNDLIQFEGDDAVRFAAPSGDVYEVSCDSNGQMFLTLITRGTLAIVGSSSNRVAINRI